ncbi:MAG: hypothetical protein HXO76_01935 [Selenomonas noxia]|jgi:hypothetical protein|nr:hypothetical protein [Selenomonas noxia]DAK12804.1 MAG TPA: tail assembly protein [Bacteriophage sp.]
MSDFFSSIGKASSMLSSIMGALNGAENGCVFTLSGANGSVEFPVSPADFEVTNPYNNETINIYGLGDINMMGRRGLATINFSSFFPAQDYSFAQPAEAPYTYVNTIKKMAESRQPAKISISGTDISLPATIEDFTFKEQDSTGDVYFSLSLKEYRYITPTSEQTNQTTGMKGRTAETVKEKKTVWTNTMHALDKAQKTMQKTATTIEQGTRALGFYRSLVKSGGIPLGTVLTTTAKGVNVGGKSLYRF